MGRAFGVVTMGLNIGGMIGPLMFGFLMDHGAPRWVFGASVIAMITVAVVALIGDRRASACRRRDPPSRRICSPRRCRDALEHDPEKHALGL